MEGGTWGGEGVWRLVKRPVWMKGGLWGARCQTEDGGGIPGRGDCT